MLKESTVLSFMLLVKQAHEVLGCKIAGSTAANDGSAARCLVTGIALLFDQTWYSARPNDDSVEVIKPRHLATP